MVCNSGASTAESTTRDVARFTCCAGSTDATGEGVTTASRERTAAVANDCRLEIGTVCRTTFDAGTTISLGSPCRTGSPSDVAGGTMELVVGSTGETGVDDCCCAFASAIVLNSGVRSRTGEIFCTGIYVPPRSRGNVPG
jgi:hypothetical protein